MDNEVGDALTRAPSRRAHRDSRAAMRRAKRRQRLVGIPMAMLGLALIGLGTYSYLRNQDADGPGSVQVGGVTQERTTTSPSTTVVDATSSTPLANLPLPGTAAEAPPAEVITPGAARPTTTTIPPPRVVTTTLPAGSTPEPESRPGG